ncbi:hypothetical protein BE221DRAFT_202987 [Ostreococcus tauri]|jgi:hypothetical protein|uniref:Uncharacterized protein n=1 Tax=Ostreococcus tauri TaxID=70448 RepID=A0A1Y5IJF9_OSTTA|nr:hypothetical protein BE221DRAFT_202987 [Ostreococcus tauri]
MSSASDASRSERGRWASQSEEARPAWVADVNADERRKKYALSEEEYANKMASRVSKHLREVRLEKYAQFEDELERLTADGSASDSGEDTPRDCDGDHAEGFDLDMALFWARRRADAVRATELRSATAIEEAERESRATRAETESEALRRALSREKSLNDRLTAELEKKTKEIERLRSQLAKARLFNPERESPQREFSARYRQARNRKLEDDLPLFTQLRRSSGDTWFTRRTSRY